MKILRVAFLLLALLPFNTMAADDFPTIETVRFVLDCMADLGELSDQNLYTCVCRHDAIAATISFSDYEEGVTYERNKAMPGERGGFFRDNERGKRLFERVVASRELANKQCITVRHIQADRH